MENYVVKFFKNTDENKYANFFKADETGAVAGCKSKIKTALAELEAAKAELEEEYAKMYSHTYEPINRVNVFRYNTRKGDDYYYDITGIAVNLDNYEDDEYTVRRLETKHGAITMLDGYCYDLASFVIKEYAYNVAADNSKCSFTLRNEYLVPFFEESMYLRNGRRLTGYNYEIEGLLRAYNSTEFINKFYGLDRHFNYDLQAMRTCQKINPAFEIIIKTAPDSLMDDLLSLRNVEKPMPVYKLLGLNQETYNRLLELGIEKPFLGLKPYIQAPEIFHKTELEWIDLIQEMIAKQADLDFFHINYCRYYARNLCPESRLLIMLADNYRNFEVLQKHYSFGKYIDYVVEETINQGFTEMQLFINELTDYLKMCSDQNITPILYSSYLQQTHDIAARNHKIYLDAHQEEVFKERYKDYKNVKLGSGEDAYQVVIPTKSEEIKHEGDALNHCVGSYLKRILDGTTLIFFLRKKPLESLITMEVKDGKICQVRGSHNRRPDAAENKAIEEYAKKMHLEMTYR